MGRWSAGILFSLMAKIYASSGLFQLLQVLMILLISWSSPKYHTVFGSMSSWLMGYTILPPCNKNYLHFLGKFIFHRDIRWIKSNFFVLQIWKLGPRKTKVPPSQVSCKIVTCAILTKTSSLLRKVQLFKFLPWTSICKQYDMPNLIESCLKQVK